MNRAWLILLLALLAAPLHAQQRGRIYAQELVERLVAREPELRRVVMRVALPTGERGDVIASHAGSAEGSVELPLQDVVGNPVGTLQLAWRDVPGTEPAVASARAARVRDALARRILNAANLRDPYPFEPEAKTQTYAQKLIEQAVATDPHIAVLAIRGPATHGGELVVLGSTFGRHGKKADADDLKIYTATDPVTGVYAGGKRFGVDLPLHDRAGATVGTMNVGYVLHAGDAQPALLAQALKLRGEFEQRIANADMLGNTDP